MRSGSQYRMGTNWLFGGALVLTPLERIGEETAVLQGSSCLGLKIYEV